MKYNSDVSDTELIKPNGQSSDVKTDLLLRILSIISGTLSFSTKGTEARNK
jgi:hypothetical protein